MSNFEDFYNLILVFLTGSDSVFAVFDSTH